MFIVALAAACTNQSSAPVSGSVKAADELPIVLDADRIKTLEIRKREDESGPGEHQDLIHEIGPEVENR